MSQAPLSPGTARAALVLSSLESQLSAVVATGRHTGRRGSKSPRSRGLWKDPSPLHACVWKICEQGSSELSPPPAPGLDFIQTKRRRGLRPSETWESS